MKTYYWSNFFPLGTLIHYVKASADLGSSKGMCNCLKNNWTVPEYSQRCANGGGCGKGLQVIGAWGLHQKNIVFGSTLRANFR